MSNALIGPQLTKPSDKGPSRVKGFYSFIIL